jgi:aspartate/methionine/tyrosine aminotransferase
MVVISDEVYQDNVFLKEKEFVSAKKVLSEMGPPYN